MFAIWATGKHKNMNLKFECEYCGKPFHRTEREVKYKRKVGRNIKFCSFICSHKAASKIASAKWSKNKIPPIPIEEIVRDFDKYSNISSIEEKYGLPKPCTTLRRKLHALGLSVKPKKPEFASDPHRRKQSRAAELLFEVECILRGKEASKPLIDNGSDFILNGKTIQVRLLNAQGCISLQKGHDRSFKTKDETIDYFVGVDIMSRDFFIIPKSVHFGKHNIAATTAKGLGLLNAWNLLK